jgi:hypothetical protein
MASGALMAQSTTRSLNLVTDFDAVGDGTTDNSVALKNALTSAWRAHAELFIPCGNFAFGTPLAIYFGSSTNTTTYGFSIRGENPTCARLLYNGTRKTSTGDNKEQSSALYISAVGPYMTGSNPNNFIFGLVIEDLYIDGNTNVADALTIVEASDSSFRNIRAGNAVTNGIHFLGAVGTSMDLLTVSTDQGAPTHSPRNCINLDGIGLNQTTTSSLIQPRVDGCSAWGLLLSSATGITISGLQADLDGSADADSGTLRINAGSANNVILQGLFGEGNPPGAWGIEDQGANNIYIGPIAYPINLAGSNLSILGGLVGTITNTGTGNRVINATSCQPTGTPGTIGPVFGTNTGVDFHYEQLNACNARSAPLPNTIGNAVTFGNTVAFGGNVGIYSDARLERDRTPIANASEIVDRLNGYYYFMRSKQDTQRQVGLVAQEVEPVLPELVQTGADGIKSVDYSRVTAVLVEASKEQQRTIREQQLQIARQQAQLDALASELAKVKASRQ